MESDIEIINFTDIPFSEKLLAKVAKKVLKEEKVAPTSLSIVLVGAERMRKLNRQYRGKNRVTDVLAFPAMKFDFSKPYNTFKELRKIEGLGEIVLCPRVIKKNARRFNLSFKQELFRCLIHGVLHLLGYDHEKNAKEGREMKEREEKYLSLLKFQITNLK